MMVRPACRWQGGGVGPVQVEVGVGLLMDHRDLGLGEVVFMVVHMVAYRG